MIPRNDVKSTCTSSQRKVQTQKLSVETNACLYIINGDDNRYPALVAELKASNRGSNTAVQIKEEKSHESIYTMYDFASNQLDTTESDDSDESLSTGSSVYIMNQSKICKICNKHTGFSTVAASL